MSFGNGGSASSFDLRDLRSLVAVYQQRHFGRAAEELGLSQPAISKSIQRLEKKFGLSLFDRSRAHVAPTAVCEALVSRAKPILARVSELDRTASMLCGLEIGSLSIGVGPAMSESYVTQAIASLAQDHPGIQIDVRVDHWRQLSQWLISGEIDLLIADVADATNDDRFLVTPLPAEEFTWFCRQGHPLAGKPVVSRQELVQFPLATPRMPPWAVAWFQEAIEADGNEPARVSLPTIRCENYSMLKRMVMQSNCVSVALAGTIEADMNDGRVVALTVNAVPLKTHAGIVQYQDRSPSPLVAAFVSRVEQLAAQRQ